MIVAMFCSKCGADMATDVPVTAIGSEADAVAHIKHHMASKMHEHAKKCGASAKVMYQSYRPTN